MSRMLKPTQAGWTVAQVTMVVATALLLTACERDASTAPRASLALVGAQNQTYSWNVNTAQNNPQLMFGNSYISIPANAICDIPSSGYGPSYWNTPCTPATGTVTITATVTGAGTDNPSVEFQPALRFNPATTVTLLLAASDTATLDNMTIIEYCSSGTPSLTNSSCFNEAISDPSLTSVVNFSNMTVTRQVKHFSGYLIAEDSSGNSMSRRKYSGSGQ
jgi:hypothetical protein